MRTTVDLDEDVLGVARHLASERAQSLGRVLSDLVRQGLRPPDRIAEGRGSIPLLPRKKGGRPVTAQAVKDLSEAEL